MLQHNVTFEMLWQCVFELTVVSFHVQDLGLTQEIWYIAHIIKSNITDWNGFYQLGFRGRCGGEWQMKGNSQIHKGAGRLMCFSSRLSLYHTCEERIDIWSNIFTVESWIMYSWMKSCIKIYSCRLAVPPSPPLVITEP